MKLIYWNTENINCITATFVNTFNTLDADFICLRGISGQLPLQTPGYEQYWFGGGAVFTKHAPLSYHCDDQNVTLIYQEFLLTTDEALAPKQQPTILCSASPSQTLKDIHLLLHPEEESGSIWVSPTLTETVYHSDYYDGIQTMDADILINGSLFSPQLPGKAVLLVPVYEPIVPEEPMPPEKPKSPLKRPLIITAFAAILCLSIFFLWDSLNSDDPTGSIPNIPTLSDSEADLFDVVTFSAKPELTNLYSAYEEDSLNSEEIFVLNDYTQDLYINSSISDYTADSSNVWILIRLTESGREYYHDSWSIEFEFSTKQYLDYISSGSVVVETLIEIENPTLPVYYDSDCTEMAGWFIYATIPITAEFTIRLEPAEYTGNYSKDITLNPFISKKLAQGYTTEYLVALVMKNDRIREFMTTPLITDSMLDFDTLYSILCESYPMLQVLQERSDAVDVLLNNVWDEDGLLTYALLSTSVYQEKSTMTEKMIFHYGQYQRCPAHLKTDLSGYTSTELIDIVLEDGLSIEAYCYEMLRLDAENTDTFIDSFITLCAPISELSTRADAVTALMNYPRHDYVYIRNLITYLLLNDSFQSNLTPYEQACIITGNFNNGTLVSFGNYEINGFNTLDSLLTRLHMRGYGTYMEQCSTTEARLYVYYILRDGSNFFELLEEQDNAVEIMESIISNNPLEDSILPYLVDLWPQIQPPPDPTAEGSTEELVNAIVNDSTLYNNLRFET